MSDSATTAESVLSSLLVGDWGDNVTNVEPEDEVAFTPVRGGGRREEPSSEVSLPYGMDAKGLKKLLGNAHLRYGNRVRNSIEKVYKILTNPLTPAGKIVWVVSGPEYEDSEVVPGSSDADKFIAAHKLSDAPFSHNAGLQIFALLLNGFDARPCADPIGEPFGALTDYIPNAKCVKDVVRECLTTLEGVHRGAKYEILEEDRNPLVIRVQVISPVEEPVITQYPSNGPAITIVAKPPAPKPKVAAAKAPAPSASASSNVASYAARTGGGAGGAVPAPTPRATLVPTIVTAPASAAPAFNGAILSEILADLAPYVGKTAQELERMHARGTLPGAVLRLLRE